MGVGVFFLGGVVPFFGTSKKKQSHILGLAVANNGMHTYNYL